MAYLIVNDQNALYKIAANDTGKNSLNCAFPPYTTIDISDDDFLKIKQNLVNINISNGSATFEDKYSFEGAVEPSISKEELSSYINSLIEYIKLFLDNNNSNNFYTECQNYFNYLENLDYTAISFPLNKPWEKYCQDNSIAYINPLQIP